MHSSTVGTSSAAGAARRVAKFTSDLLRGSTLDFILGFTPSDHLPTKSSECDLSSTICLYLGIEHSDMSA